MARWAGMPFLTQGEFMNVNELFERLQKLIADGLGSAPVEVRNPAGDTCPLEEIRNFEGTIYLED